MANPMNHGTQTCYRYHKCRCEACRMAMRIAASKSYQRNRAKRDQRQRAYTKEWRKRPIGDGPGERKITHGNGGAVAGCKCDICRKAHREYNRTLRMSKRAPMVGADLIRIVIREYQESKNGKREHYPYKQMEIGDSFLFPCDPDKLAWAQRTVAMAWRRQAPKKFTTRREENGIRVWRIQ